MGNGVNFKDLALELRDKLSAETLRADTAEAERDALRNEIGQVKGEYDRAVNKVAAAEQRISELLADNQQLRKLLKQTLAALNPTAKLAKSIRAALNLKPEAGSHE